MEVRYGRKVAVRHCSFAVDVGGFYALLGRNGAGKSTVVQSLMGFRKTYAGALSVLSLDPWKDRRPKNFVNPRRSLMKALIAAFAVLVALPGQLTSQEDPMEPLRVTVRNVRNLGSALFTWYNDHGDMTDSIPEMKQVDLGSIGTISFDELEEMLVPQYIQELPRTDGWGHPLEVRLELELNGKVHAAAIRAPARDGVFESEVYDIAPYSASDLDHDVVWVDGYFVAYPKADDG